MDSEKLKMAIEITFRSRNTHPLPAQLPDAPQHWTVPFNALALECKLDWTIEETVTHLRTYLANF